VSQLRPEHESRERRDELGYEPELRYEPYEPPDWAEPSPIRHEPRFRLLRKLAAPFIFLGVMLWKFKFVLAAIFKFKVFTVAGSMLVSVGAYALIWGWAFAVGFVVLLFIHEMGHALEAKRQGLKVGAPFFIPFMGAVIALKQMPHNAWREAQLALAGPIVGSLGAAAFWAYGEATGTELLVALAFTGFFLNLFNLLPIVPLDGGRAVAALHPAFWAVGLVGLLALVFLAPNPILILILVLGGMELWRRWRERKFPELQEYYRVTPAQRIAVGVTYVGLAVLLVLAMDASFIERDFDDA
jgi:Zn-dependent protease